MSRNTNDYGSTFLREYTTGPYLLRGPNEQSSGITKACTPTRPRLIPTGELNGTPIALARKGTSERIASPLLARINKENQQTNIEQPSPGKLAIKIKPSLGLEGLSQNRAKSPYSRDAGMKALPNTLSPFNKMSQGLKNYMQYGTIPNNDALSGIEKYATIRLKPEAEKNQETETLKSSNSFKLLGSRKNSQANLSPLGLQRDKSHGNLQDEKKLKNEVIDDIIKNCGKKQQQNALQNLRISNGTNAFGGLNTQKPLSDSRSFGKFQPNKFRNAIRQSTTHDAFLHNKQQDIDHGQINCLNKDGKKAKYRVVNNNPDEDEQPMYYCSKCAIQLIQQGFKVEEIQQNEPMLLEHQDSGSMSRINQLTERLTSKRDRLKKNKQSFSQLFQKDLNQIDAYYDSLISTIEEIRVKDRQVLLQHRDKSQQGAEDLLNRYQLNLNKLSQMTNDTKRKAGRDPRMDDQLKQITQLCDAPERSFRKEVQVEQSVQDKFDHFVNNLYQNYTLRIEEVHHQQESQPPSREQAFNDPGSGQQGKTINFSFEKNKLRVGKKLDALQPYIKEQSEIDERNESEEEIMREEHRKPFRNLFPDESQQENSQICQENLMSSGCHEEARQQFAGREEDQGCGDCYSPSFKNI